MRILEAVSTRGANGAVRYARRIIPELLERGHEVALLALPGSWIAGELEGRVRVFETGFDRWPLSELKRVARLVREGGFDLVHSHLTRANIFCALLHALYGVRNVAHAHENRPHPHYWFHDLVLAVSMDTLRRHRRYGAARGKRGKPLPNFVDTRVYRPAAAGETDLLREELSLEEAKPVLLQVGDISRRKGQTVTLAAMPGIWESFPEAHIAFIGSGDPPEAPDDPRIHWLGAREDVPELLPRATIALMPSTVEPFGLAAIEAMACRVPLVASRVDGLQEVIGDGHAMPVQPESPEELAAAVKHLLRYPEERAEQADRAFSMVRERYGLERHMDSLEASLAHTF